MNHAMIKQAAALITEAGSRNLHYWREESYIDRLENDPDLAAEEKKYDLFHEIEKIMKTDCRKDEAFYAFSFLSKATKFMDKKTLLMMREFAEEVRLYNHTNYYHPALFAEAGNFMKRNKFAEIVPIY